ncbi:MAG: potassium transporter TrkA [candidate division Zixibacteria bacterium RBG_16_43_9]|nr:MAG: potassium transporter TrkA [candidate division Zixibacteria bacterium RBG_16_43_9]
MEAEKKLKIALGALLIVIVIGTLGYSLIEGWDILDSLYMSVITISTVGFQEVHQLSSTGRVFTIFFIIFGVGTTLYAVGAGAQLMLEGQIRSILGRRKMSKKIQEIKDHYIICGYGKVGQQIYSEFSSRQVACTVVEKNPEVVEKAIKDGVLVIQGDSTLDSVLEEAGIKRAKGLISAVASEADNVVISLSARELNPEIVIVARAETEESEKKLLRAGANRAISPHTLGGTRMALAALRPHLVDFMQVATSAQGMEMRIEELEVKEGSTISNSTLKDCELRLKVGVIVLGIHKKSGQMLFTPPPDAKMEPGDTLIAIGKREDLEKLEKLTSS